MSLKRRKSILEFDFFDSVETQLLSDFTAFLIDSETSGRKLFHRTEHGVRGVFQEKEKRTRRSRLPTLEMLSLSDSTYPLKGTE